MIAQARACTCIQPLTPAYPRTLYVYDGNSNIVEQTMGGVTSTSTYDATVC